MDDYLVFDTPETAETALETIYANMIAAIDSADLLNVATQEVVEKDTLTPNQMVEVDASTRYYPIFGVNASTGVKVEQYGYTKAWAVKQQRVTDGKWVFQKPDDSLMVNVIGYTVEPYDVKWFKEV